VKRTALPEPWKTYRPYGHRYFQAQGGRKVDADIARSRHRPCSTLPAPYYASLDRQKRSNMTMPTACRTACWPASRHPALTGCTTPSVHRTADQPQGPRWPPTFAAEPIPPGDHRRIRRRACHLRVRANAVTPVCPPRPARDCTSRCSTPRAGATWNADRARPRYFLSAEDLTNQAGPLGAAGFGAGEPARHHPTSSATATLTSTAWRRCGSRATRLSRRHPDLYERSHGAVAPENHARRIALGSLDCAGYASAAQPDFSVMQAIN